MKLTKFGHACFTVEIDDQVIAVDPGKFSGDFEVTNNLLAIILTHQHPDHSDEDLLRDILRRYPDLKIITTDDNHLDTKHEKVNAGDEIIVGPFTLKFFGGQHAIIDQRIPRIKNIGLTVNSQLCYPGDSFDAPGHDIHTLLLPVAAPWMKISEALNYLHDIKPQRIIPTHDAILSPAGQGVVDNLVGQVAEELSIPYTRLTSGQSVTIN